MRRSFDFPLWPGCSTMLYLLARARRDTSGFLSPSQAGDMVLRRALSIPATISRPAASPSLNGTQLRALPASTGADR